MKTNSIYLSELGTMELSLNELIQIEGGGFWNTLGKILGVVAAVAAVLYAPPAVLVLL